jgi:hypothetical protein
MSMAKRNTKEVWQPPTIEQMIESWRKDLAHRAPLPTPTRFFYEGESVGYGGHKNVTVVLEVDGGMGYVVHYDYIDEQSRQKHKVGDQVVTWLSLYPIHSGDTSFGQKDDLQIRFYNNDIECLLHRVHGFGVNFEPDYQRGLVWSYAQKLALLDSIFANIDIGKFTFNDCIDKMGDGRAMYEIIDGKQRLSALCEFYEGRMQYNGHYFHQLSWKDRHHFLSFPIIVGDMKNATGAQILKLFIKMNTSGKPMDAAHLEKVRQQLEGMTNG